MGNLSHQGTDGICVLVFIFQGLPHFDVPSFFAHPGSVWHCPAMTDAINSNGTWAIHQCDFGAQSTPFMFLDGARGMEKWNDPYEPSNWWFPFRASPKPVFIGVIPNWWFPLFRNPPKQVIQPVSFKGIPKTGSCFHVPYFLHQGWRISGSPGPAMPSLLGTRCTMCRKGVGLERDPGLGIPQKNSGGSSQPVFPGVVLCMGFLNKKKGWGGGAWQEWGINP